MIARFTRPLAHLVIRFPGWVAAAALIVTLVLFSHIHALRTSTDLTDMFGAKDPQWQAVSKIGNELGYGNQLYVLVLAPEGGQDRSEQMEQVADRLTEEMSASGLFKSARSGLSEEELLGMVRLFSWNFPVFADAENRQAIRDRLDPKQIHANVRAAATELVTPFSTLGTNYFVADPLGLTAAAARNSQGLSQFGSFDLTWGEGNRFFSKDHKALLIIAEPRQPAVDYQYAHQVMEWAFPPGPMSTPKKTICSSKRTSAASRWSRSSAACCFAWRFIPTSRSSSCRSCPRAWESCGRRELPAIIPAK